MKSLTLLLASTALATAAIMVPASAENLGTSTEATDSKQQLSSGVDVTALDRTIRPQDDFYAFANGGWVKNTEIPAIYSRYSIFHEVYEDAERDLRKIIEDAAATGGASGTERQKVGDLFATWMDTDAIEAQALTPLGQELELLSSVKNKKDIVELLAHSIRYSTELPFSIAVYPDLKNSSEYAVYVSQNGLTLPNRDYYLELENERFKAAREGLAGFIKTMVAFVDSSITDERAQAVFDLETRIAEHQWTNVQNRDDEATYNPYKPAELKQLGTNIDWSSLLKGLGLDKADKLIVSQPSYFEAMDQMVGDVSLQTWKDYLAYNLMRNNSAHLTKAVDDATFEYLSKTVFGQKQQRPRWKRGVSIVNGALGEAVGKLYVERHFPAEAKIKMNELVGNVLAIFDESIEKLEWMSPETKKAAKAKRAKFTAKIGYPDVWRDYSALEIVKGDHFGNIQRIRAFDYHRQIDKLGKPIDKNEWYMTPQTVNAYYSPTQNEIVFPAARLQPPFFQLDADDAINYGAIGGVIGHEISHGFDDSGSKYDGDGNLKNWWTDEDRKAFEERTKMLIQQYSEFEPLEGMNLQGALTLGENIGDLSGVTVAYRAYIRSLNGKEPPVIDGFTGPQRFFIGYAMSRKGKYNEQSLARQIAAGPHSPLKYRVNGVYRNMPEFYEAFGVKEGDGMWLAPEDRVSIW